MAKRKRRQKKQEIPGLKIRRDKLTWGHRPGLLFTEHPELVSVTLDAGEAGIHLMQLRPYTTSIELRDGNGQAIDLPLPLVAVLCEELPKLVRQVVHAETVVHEPTR